MMEMEVRVRAANARRICTAHGIAQADIAAHVGASQSQVSRILKGEGIRASRLFEEVCLFVERFEGGISADAVRGNSELIEALQATWDGSASHAKALAAVIRSLAIFRST
ncbi:helix-turn-helix transcriptional regulator [Delftia lacustris]|uniref:helix-turn-helix transcriptional regulator n=1 Tax=Delftia lacustris TaxID=558537 RepID=UPI0009E45D7B|nr:helix-turn-helix transcriptional regulator [Delftia lacustris]